MAKITKVSPLAPAAFPELPVIPGVRFATAEAGVRYQGRTDVMLAVLDPGTAVAGVFTRSSTRSAPVLDCQAKIGGDSAPGAAVLVNSGNSNAFTGHRGQVSVAKTTGVPVGRGVAVGRVGVAMGVLRWLRSLVGGRLGVPPLWPGSWAVGTSVGMAGVSGERQAMSANSRQKKRVSWLSLAIIRHLAL